MHVIYDILSVDVLAQAAQTQFFMGTSQRASTGITERAMASAGQASCAGGVSTVRERLIDILMTKVLKHDIRDQCFTPASLHSHVCGIDKKNLRPTVAEVAGIAATSTKHVQGKIFRRYVTVDDQTGFWISLDYSSASVHLGKLAGRKRKHAHDDS